MPSNWPQVDNESEYYFTRKDLLWYKVPLLSSNLHRIFKTKQHTLHLLQLRWLLKTNSKLNHLFILTSTNSVPLTHNCENRLQHVGPHYPRSPSPHHLSIGHRRHRHPRLLDWSIWIRSGWLAVQGYNWPLWSSTKWNYPGIITIVNQFKRSFSSPH